MNDYAETIRIEELTLKSLEGQLTEAERDELEVLLAQPDNFKAYQEMIASAASLQDLDELTDRIESRIHETPRWLRPALNLAAAACVAVGILAGLQLLNRPAGPVEPVIAETIFSQTSDWNQRVMNLELKIQKNISGRTRLPSGGRRYQRVKSEIKTLQQTPVLGKENNDV